tara:strand:+ start:353 stop:592 length:240 start_codon:yes stop_codon:yes gene_type:complete
MGCATTANNTQDKLNTWIGSNIDDFLIQVTPETITNLTSGGKKYDFRTRENIAFAIVCDYAFITDKDGKIISVTKPYCW